MLEATGNIWDLPGDAICITTNGFVKKDGSCVMGRGIALEAKNKFPRIEYLLGELIKNEGNNVYSLFQNKDNFFIFSFPVKHNWWEKADINLIKKSCLQLIEIVDNLKLFDLIELNAILIPRPGCGNGKLNWFKDVKPVIENILDDRFIVVTNE